MRYLLVSHIPFAQADDGSVVLDRLWAEDLKGLVASMGPVTVAAPRMPSVSELQGWGPGTVSVSSADGLTFVALPVHQGRRDLTFSYRVRRSLGKAVREADLIHTSNLFFPYTALYYGHDLAVKLKKKTLFVVAEDFYDMLCWEWVRTATSGFQQYRRLRSLKQLDGHVRKRVSSASLTFLHTPAAVARYREFAANAVAIRQPVHEQSDVIDAEGFQARCKAVAGGSPLELVTACRMEPLKGVDFIVRAVALLKQRQIAVRAKLYGGGRELESLKALAQTLDVADIVQFPGPLPTGPPLREALCKAHIFLMPHLTSDFGRAFFDAMAAATPVIAFRSIASQDTVRHRVDGMLTPNADFEGLADALAQFDADRGFLVRCSEAARGRAIANTKSVWNQLRTAMIRELF